MLCVANREKMIFLRQKKKKKENAAGRKTGAGGETNGFVLVLAGSGNIGGGG